MIDTIKFYIPIIDVKILEKLKGQLMRFKKDDMKTGEVEFCFYTSQAELGSYSRTINIRANDNPQGLFIEFSVPKYEKGNNVEMIYPHNLENIWTFMNFRHSPLGSFTVLMFVITGFLKTEKKRNTL